MQAGLAFISAQLDDRPYQLFDPNDPTSIVTVRLPESLVDLSDDRCKLNMTLEAT